MTRPGIWIGVAAICALSASCSPARAVDALTFPIGPGSDVTAEVHGGAGWSFVPTTNLVVTSVGYLTDANGGGNPNVVVTIWSGTNRVLASYTGITDPSAPPNTIVSATIPSLALAAGQPYAITVYTAPLSNSISALAVHDNSGVEGNNPFRVAPELAQYQGLLLSQTNTFAPLSTSPTQNSQLLYLGPTFTYQVGTLAPRLTIALAGSNSVILAWPTNAVGFSLQRSPAVMTGYANVTNAPSVVGANYTTTLPSTNAAAFFRLAK
jgi:hypothetical protein